MKNKLICVYKVAFWALVNCNGYFSTLFCFLWVKKSIIYSLEEVECTYFCLLSRLTYESSEHEKAPNSKEKPVRRLQKQQTT